MVIIPANKKPIAKKPIAKKPVVKKSDFEQKLRDFLENGKDWQVKHFGVSDIVKVQILPENKTNPKRLAIFLTTQGRGGRKGLRITNKEIYIAVSESLLHEKTAEIINILERINPSGSETPSDVL